MWQRVQRGTACGVAARAARPGVAAARPRLRGSAPRGDTCWSRLRTRDRSQVAPWHALAHGNTAAETEICGACGINCDGAAAAWAGTRAGGRQSSPAPVNGAKTPKTSAEITSVGQDIAVQLNGEERETFTPPFSRSPWDEITHTVKTSPVVGVFPPKRSPVPSAAPWPPRHSPSPNLQHFLPPAPPFSRSGAIPVQPSTPANLPYWWLQPGRSLPPPSPLPGRSCWVFPCGNRSSAETIFFLAFFLKKHKTEQTAPKTQSPAESCEVSPRLPAPPGADGSRVLQRVLFLFPLCRRFPKQSRVASLRRHRGHRHRPSLSHGSHRPPPSQGKTQPSRGGGGESPPPGRIFQGANPILPPRLLRERSPCGIFVAGHPGFYPSVVGDVGGLPPSRRETRARLCTKGFPALSTLHE